MPIEIYRCDLCAREGESKDLPCYSFIDPDEDCLYGNTDNPEWESMHTQTEIDRLQKALEEVLENIKYFTDRVEAGTIRSKPTYAIYKNILAKYNKALKEPT